jgi:hypothetical protein
MRTIIDIPEQDIKALDAIKADEGVSRNELVKRGVAMLLKTYQKTEVDAFGLWYKEQSKGQPNQAQDGLDYQLAMREEW